MTVVRVVIFAVCCTAAALAAATGGGCASASCILPVPLPAPPRLSLTENLQLIRCHLSCISEQHIDIELLNQESVWPSYAYSSLPCTSRQKVDQCTTGCMTSHRSPSLTVNRCRDQCVSECEAGEDTVQDGCDTSCRRTFCRYGCNVYQSLPAESSSALSMPTAAPAITSHPDSDSATKLFIANVSAAMPSQQARESSALSNTTPQNVTYLYKIQHGNNTSYIWQRDTRIPLDLSAFSCSQIQVSFSVVTQRSRSEFSPAHSLCVEGVGRWPSRVNHSSINISYSEDTRDAYRGYSTVNISWTRPQGYQYLTSYTIIMYASTASCGGPNRRYTQKNIGKDATWYFISANELNGVPRFGCSYVLSVVSMPEETNRNRPTTTMAPQLAEPDPEMRLDCRRVWDERGFMNISVGWSLSSSSPLPAIRRFTVVPLLIDSSQPGLFGRLYEYPRHWTPPESEKVDYSVLLTDFAPQRTESYKYKIEIRVERTSGYFWRRVPPTKTCTLSADSEPPGPVTELSVTQVQTDREGGGGLLAQFHLSWSVPLTTNGILTEYEVNVVTGAAGDGTLLYHSTHPASKLSVEVNLTFPLNTSTHCIYALVRSRNDYVWSDWSKPKTVPLDQQCQSSVSDSLNNSVTLFYKRAGEEAVRIAQISCDSGLNTTTSNTISDRLLFLEQRLKAVPDMMRVQSMAESLLERLRTLESKIDQIVNAVSSQSGSGG